MDAVTGGRQRPTTASGVIVAMLAVILAVLSFSGSADARSSVNLVATYDVSVHLDWERANVRVGTTIEVLNTSAGPIDRIVLNTVAAQLGSMRNLRTRIDGFRVRPRVAGQTITLPLRDALPEGEAATVRVAYQASLRTTNAGRNYLWSKLGGVAHLYRFIPWISRRIPFGTQAHGEPFLTPVSPRINVTATSDRRLTWATTGQQVQRDGKRHRFEAQDVRDFVMVASPVFRIARGASRDGDTSILAYTLSADGRRLVTLARKELDHYERKTGVDYPYPTYRIAETGAGLPMEAPGLIWIPASRSPSEYPFLVSHETAHQWFYGIVGNDQSTNAFADEALADYFSRRAHLSVRPSRCPTDRLDRDIRRYSTRCYFEVIYVQGARFLDQLRRDFGGPAFLRAVQAYSADERLGIGSNAKLLEAFRAEMGDRVVKRFSRRFPSIYPAAAKATPSPAPSPVATPSPAPSPVATPAEGVDASASLNPGASPLPVGSPEAGLVPHSSARLPQSSARPGLAQDETSS